MHKKTNFTVLGKGEFALALSGQISSRGGSVSILDPSPDQAFHELAQLKTIQLTGFMEVQTPIDSMSSDYQLLKTADVIIIIMSPSAIEAISDQLIASLHPGQHVVILPGCFGGLQFKNKVAQHSHLRGITVSEAVSVPFVSSLENLNTIKIHKLKNELKLATCPAERNSEVIQLLNRYLDVFVPAANLIETSLENVNSVLHPFPILLNLIDVERKGTEFRHFIDGINPHISSLIEQMDEERIQVGKAYSLKLTPVLEQLKQYYGDNDSQNLYEFVNSPQSPYRDVKGFGINSRYITDDIPNLAVPIHCLGSAAEVPTPLFDTSIHLSSKLMNTNYVQSGLNMDKLQMNNKSRSELLNKASQF